MSRKFSALLPLVAGAALALSFASSILAAAPTIPPLKSAADKPVVAKPGPNNDWSQWRGPNRDGVSLDTGLLKKWPEGGPPLLYCFKDVGNGYCPPSIVGNKAYITGKFGQNDAILMAFELPETLPKGTPNSEVTELPFAGKMLWKVKYGNSCGSGENAAPVVVGDQIFVTSGDGDVAGISTSGKLLWSLSMKKDFKAFVQTNGSYGFSESPLVDGDKVIVCPGTADAVMIALNKDTGQLIWKAANPNGSERDAASHCSTMLSYGGGVKQYVNLTGWGLVGVSPEGKFLWGYKKTCESSVPTPIIRGDYVFAVSSYGFGSICMKLEAGGDTGINAKVVYQLPQDKFACLCGQAVLVGDYVYTGHGLYAGEPRCVNLLTGKPGWSEKQSGSGVAGLISADGLLFFRNESKEIVVIAADPQKYNLVSKWIPASHQNGYAPPVVAHGLLYLRDRNLVQVFDIRQH